MRIPRIFTPQPLASGQQLELESQASHHLSKVLRMQVGAPLVLFNGEGGEYQASIVEINKKFVSVMLGQHNTDNRQSPLAVHMGIAMSKGDRMDWVMQKATELGVRSITPLVTERTELKLKGDRAEKKLSSWQKIIHSACEQCQLNIPPNLHTVASVNDWCSNIEADKKFVLHHRNQQGLNPAEQLSSVAILIGPEGGLSDMEIALANNNSFQSLALGPRVLRTETAPLAALTLLQSIWGDL